MQKKKWNIAVVGATTVTGEQIIACLEERDFPVGKVTLLSGSPGADEDSPAVRELKHDSFKGIDIAFFSAESRLSLLFCPYAWSSGAVCIDTSGAWRMDPTVPLVAPDVNLQAIEGFNARGIIAVPAASVIQMATILKPLHDFGTIRRVVVSTYHSVSGSGKRAIEELHGQVLELLNARMPESQVYPHRIAFNCLPQVGSFNDNAYTSEEMKLVDETRRLLGPDMGITATAVRIPVFYGHCESINVETERKIDAAQARELISHAPGCELLDDPSDRLYPMVSDAAGQDLVQVGRIREDDSIDNGLNLWAAADNVRLGAVSAVRIAEALVGKHLK